MEQLLQQIASIVVDSLKLGFLLQGHKLTGTFENSLRTYTETAVNGYLINFEMPDYAAWYVNNGVNYSKIPYGGSSGRGKGTGTISKYIQGLKSYFELRRNLSEKDALKAAFALANYRKKNFQGMPTEGSYKYSYTGKRTGIIGESVDAVTPQIENLIIENINEMFTFALKFV